MNKYICSLELFIWLTDYYRNLTQEGEAIVIPLLPPSTQHPVSRVDVWTKKICAMYPV